MFMKLKMRDQFIALWVIILAVTLGLGLFSVY